MRCSPLASAGLSSRPLPGSPAARRLQLAKPLSGTLVVAVKNGRRSCRPRLPAAERGDHERHPWRERPRIYPACAAKPAASAWSLTPRLPVTVEVHRQRDPWVVTTANPSLHRAAILPRPVPWNQRPICSR